MEQSSYWENQYALCKRKLLQSDELSPIHASAILRAHDDCNEQLANRQQDKVIDYRWIPLSFSLR